jgi:hypothetical protein
MSGWSESNGGIGVAHDGVSPSLGRLGWSSGDTPATIPSETRDRESVHARGSAFPRSLARRMSRAFTLGLSLLGAAAGAALLGYYARQTGHPTADVAKIAGLGAVAGASVGAALIPALRAITWSVVTACIAALGAGALWLVYRLVPLLLRNITDRLW